MDLKHMSDCGKNNAPAYQKTGCTCGVEPIADLLYDFLTENLSDRPTSEVVGEYALKLAELIVENTEVKHG